MTKYNVLNQIGCWKKKRTLGEKCEIGVEGGF